MNKRLEDRRKRKLERVHRNQTIMDMYGDLRLTPTEIARRLDIHPKLAMHIVRSNRSREENEQAVKDHRAKVHLNFKRKARA